MQVTLSPDDEQFCNQVREFIATNLPPDIAEKVEKDQILAKDDYVRWQQILGKKGWLAYTWSAENGGPGWNIVRQYLFDAISSEMNCPPIIPFGTRMVGPVIQAFGTPAQKDRFIGPILHSTEWWCQGYSEPMAGSDLTALKTRAEDRGDHYLVNGQKIWTSWAHYADWMFCLVRTSRHDRPQKGITFLLLDMNSPGVEITPIVALDGTHSLNAVFFTDVRVPKENRIGNEGDGWTYAKFLLSHERLDNASVGFAKRLLKKLKKIAAGEAGGGLPLDQDPAFRLKLVDVEVRLIALDLRVLQMLAEMAAGGSPGPAVSSLKIRGTELCQRILELTMEAAGYYAMPYQKSLILGASEEAPVGPSYAATSAARYFNRRAMSIFGGTNEIQKNIIAKAVLGLG
jgi:alkylation response protein AidB-like acyl-CoA dehydrogenase